jgi:hypothetical protein
MSINKLIAVVAGLLLALLAPLTAAADTQAASPLTYSVKVGDRSVSTASESRPLILDPKRQTQVEVTLTNGGNQPVTVRSIGINGKILGLTLFNVRTAATLTVAPGRTETLAFAMDISDLDGQATGLVGGEFSIRLASGKDLETDVVSEVRGSLFSVYGLFGLGLLVMTIVAAIDVALAISRGRLPENRFRRGLLTMAPGVGVGLVMIFSLSALGVWVPTGPRWILSVLIFAGACFAVGYFTGTPDSAEDDDDETSVAVEAAVFDDTEHGAATDERVGPHAVTRSGHSTVHRLFD